jgi:nicotinamide-nucleotide adenylyltransferase
MMWMAKRGLYVGRFQPFHLGHVSVIKHILGEMDEIVLVVGSAQYSHNLRNPFTAGERITMIRGALEGQHIACDRVWVIPVPDMHLHMMWVSSVKGYTPRFDVVYANEPLTSRLFKEAGYKVKSVPFYERKSYSSTLIREKMLKDNSWETLVPKSVAAFIVEIDGVNRLRDLNRTDKA